MQSQSRIPFILLTLLALSAPLHAHAEDLALRDTDRFRFVWQGALVHADANVALKVSITVGDETDKDHVLKSQVLTLFKAKALKKDVPSVFKDSNEKSTEIGGIYQRL